MVHSIKHYVQHSIATVTGGGVTALSISHAVAPDAVDLVNEVIEGCSIKAVYVELWIRSASTTGSSGQMIIFKKGSDATNPSATEMAALGDWDNKKNILYTTMGLFNDVDADAIALFKGWIKIPKGKQRQGLNDQLVISIFSPTVDAHVCGFVTYKEYT